MKITFLAIVMFNVPVSELYRRRRHDGYSAVTHHAHQLLAPSHKFFLVH
jgi:hypothetical protein